MVFKPFASLTGACKARPLGKRYALLDSSGKYGDFYDNISAIAWPSDRFGCMDDGDVVVDVRYAASCYTRREHET
tara:strand:- start:7981 stop:8205 length:225 start_codon:yes stop_codon:yes gene_type:complete